MKIRDYLKTNKILCDGAFGTYYAAVTGDGSMPERANLENPEVVRRIHAAYIQAGARMIRTNTFAASREQLGCGADRQQENLRAAVRLAKEAAAQAKETVYVAGDIGPIPFRADQTKQQVLEEYLWIAGVLLDSGVDILLFETFSDYEQIVQAGRRLKQQQDLFVIMQFSVNQHGYTNVGLSAKRIVNELSAEESVDAVGFNCGVGPGHLYRIMQGLDLQTQKYLTALPNASYPKTLQDRVVFLENQDYFVRKAADLATLGIDLIGGCCGTNPRYIAQAAAKIELTQRGRRKAAPKMRVPSAVPKKDSAFYAGNKTGKKLLAVELAPPFHADDEKIMDASNYLKGHCVDVVTLPDSPSGRTRADSIMMGIKVAQQTGVCVMPHICCRDKNAIAIRAQLLGAYMNGIRNLLVVTGDPVPSMMRGDVRSVYNFDSVGLMRIIKEMNADEFAEDPIVYGGALSYNRRNLEVEIGRMYKKMEAGASFFLTQPLFTKADAQRLRSICGQVPGARILCGVMPLVSKKNALFIKNEMAGIHVTDEIVSSYRDDMTREEGERVGIDMVKNVIRMTEDFAQGYYMSIPFNRVYLADGILGE